MKKQNIIIILTIVLTSLFSIKVNAQEGSKKDKNCSCCSSETQLAMHDSTKMMHKNHKMMKHDSTKMMQHKDHKMTEQKDSLDSIVREGKIDIVKIDKNKDGKVFQDQMCWNVISDEAGRCPLCNMKLKEVSIEHAKKKLVEEGYKVKK